ncbi:hypothetical protein ACFL0W_03030 [Nanoarchaeota archaeon]
MAKSKKTKIQKITNSPNNLDYLVFSLLVLIVVIFPLSFSLIYGGIVQGDEPYYHIRAAEAIKNGITDDRLTMDQREFIIVPLHYVMAGLGYLIGMNLTSISLPIIFSIAIFIFFHLTLKNIIKIPRKRSLIEIILIISPSFIYLSSFLTQHQLPILLTLMCMFFFTKKQSVYWPISLILVTILSFFSFFNFALAILLMLIYSKTMSNPSIKGRKNWIMMSVFGGISVIILLGTKIFTQFSQPEIITFRNFISDLGAETGFSIFLLVLFFMGLTEMWRNVKKDSENAYNQYYLAALLVFALIFILYVGNEINLYLIFLASFLAGNAFYYLFKTNWNFKLLKQLTIFLILCGLIFSSVSYINKLSSEMRNQDFISAAQWLKENTNENNLIFAHQKDGFFIQTVSNRKVLSDDLSFKDILFKEKTEDSDILLLSKNYQKTTRIIKKYDIKYLFLNKKLLEGAVWSEKDSGLLFLLRNTETFIKVFDNPSVVIYEIGKIEE